MRPGAWRARRGWIESVCLGLILAEAAVLRFYALPQRGLVYWDEGKFALEGVRLETALHSLFTGGAVVAGKAVGTAKPTHALLIALGYGLFGVHDYAALFVNATCSVLAVLVTFLIAREVFGPRTALVAAALFAVSEYDVVYARSALSESDANLVFLLGVLIWISGRTRLNGYSSRLIAGVLMGLAFTTNYRLIVYIAAVVGFDLIWRLLERGWVQAIRRIGPWAAGLVAAPLLWEVLDVVTRSQGTVLFRSEQTGGQRSYLSQVVYQLHQGRQSHIHFNPGLYLHWYVLRSGWPLFILLLVGMAIAVWRGLGHGRPSYIDSGLGHGRPSYIDSGLGHGRPSYIALEGEVGSPFAWWAMLVPVIIPYVIYIFAPFIVARNLDAALPFAAVLSAAAIVQLVDWLWKLLLALRGAGRSRRLNGGGALRFGAVILLFIFVLALSAAETSMSWRLTSERSGYARAASFVEQYGQGKALVSSEILVFYLRSNGPQCAGATMPGTLTRLVADAGAGYHYAILDHASGTIKVLVRKWTQPVARYPAVGRLSLGENLLESEVDPQTKRPLQTVTIYRINASSLQPIGARPDFCNRERV